MQRLNEEMVQRLPVEEVKQRLAREGVEAITASAAATAKLYAEQYATWAKVIEQAGIMRQ